MMTKPNILEGILRIPRLNVDRKADAAWERKIFDYYKDDPTLVKTKVRECRIRTLTTYIHNQFIDDVREKFFKDPTSCAHCGKKISDDEFDTIYGKGENRRHRPIAELQAITCSFWTCSIPCYWGQCFICREKKRKAVNNFLELEDSLGIDAIYAAL